MILQDYDKYMVHLKPIGELFIPHKPHLLTIACWCKPVIDKDEPTIIIHNERHPENID